jgi:acetyl esterase/lipase
VRSALLLTLAFCAATSDSDLRSKYERWAERHPPDRTLQFAAADGHELDAHWFAPASATGPLPLTILLHGGGWRRGSPSQFFPWCRRIAARGGACVSAAYRLAEDDGSDAVDAIDDVRRLLAFVAENAARLGVDPERIALGGGSAGGHLAAAAALVPGEPEPPALRALVLFNPAVDIAYPFPGFRLLGPIVPIVGRMNALFRGDPTPWSPERYVRPGLPPVWITHGTADGRVEFEASESFCRELVEAGNRCTLVPVEGADHGFFNEGCEAFEATWSALVPFLEAQRLVAPADAPADGALW